MIRRGLFLLFAVMLCVQLLPVSAIAQDDDCADAPPPRLTVDSRARVTPGEPNNVRNQPSRNATLMGAIPGDGEFTVLDGPVCADGLYWWLVIYGEFGMAEELLGWTVEGSGDTYWLEPFEPACEPVLLPGEPARSYDEISIHVEPDQNAQQIGTIPPDTLFDVQFEVQCDQFHDWAVVTYDGITGWIQATTEVAGPYVGFMSSHAQSEPRPLPTVEGGMEQVLPSPPLTLDIAPNALTATNIQNIQQSGVFGEGLITSFTWSPNGTEIAVSGSLDGRLYTAERLSDSPRIFDAHDPIISLIRYRPDGQVLATADEGGRLVLWNPQSSDLLSTVQVDFPIHDVVFSADSTLMAVAAARANAGFVAVYDVTTPEQPQPLYEINRMSGSRMEMAFTNDNRYLLILSHAIVLTLDLTTGEERQPFPEFQTPSGLVDWALTSDNRTLVVVSEQMIGDVTQSFFYYMLSANLDTGTGAPYGRELTLPGFRPVQGHISLQFGSDGTLWLLMGNQLHWYAVERSRGVTLDIPASNIRTIEFSPQTSQVAIGGSQGEIRLYHIDSQRNVSQSNILYGIVGEVRHIQYSPDGTQIAASGPDNTVRVWDVASAQRRGTIRLLNAGHPFALSPDGTQLLSGIHLWDIATQRVVDTLQNPDGLPIDNVGYTADGTPLIISDYGVPSRIWNALTGEYVIELEQDSRFPIISPDGRLIAYRHDGGVMIVNSADGQIINHITDYRGSVYEMQFSPDSRLLMTYDSGLENSGMATMLVHNINTGDLLANIPLDAPNTDDGVWSPDGTRVAWIGFDREGDEFRHIASIINLAQPTNPVTAVLSSALLTTAAFSQDSSLLAVGDSRGLITFVDVATGEIIHTLQAHNGQVMQLQFAEGGAALYSAGEDATIRIWRVP